MAELYRGIVGTICHSDKKLYERFDWKIENFFSLSKTHNDYYKSPDFDYGDSSWCLQLYACQKINTDNCIQIKIRSMLSDFVEHIHYAVGIVTAKRNLEVWLNTCEIFDGDKVVGEESAVQKLSELMYRKSELFPSNCLTITIIMSAKVPPLFRDCADASIQTDANFEVFNNGSGNQGPAKALEDIGKLFISGDNSDVVVLVGDVEFQAHRNILAARTPVLCAMFQHDTAEKASNKICISDCEPDVFKEFLHYIYTGTVQHLTVGNVFDLYRVADKYLTSDLKQECLMYIQNTLCVETFCNTLQLALRHKETRLLQLAIDFATENIRTIIQTVEWQNFNQEHPAEATELLIKSLGPPCFCHKFL